MKNTFKILKIFIIMVLVTMLVPFTMVNAASTKTEEIIKKLNSSDTLKSINGKAKYEDDSIQIEYSITNTSSHDISFPCEDNVIVYSSGDITNYEEAEDALTHSMYATLILSSVLKLNGYTQEQINSFFQSEDNELDYERNGIEIKETGEEKKFTGGQYNSTLTVTPVLIKIDVSRANLNTSSDDKVNLTENTIEDVVADLKEDDEFTSYEDEDGKILSENEIKYEDNSIEISNTAYSYDYHNISFPCENDVLTYETGEITSYDEANYVSEHEMWALMLIQYALEANGYTQEQINKFFQSEDGKLDYERNGIEFKEIGEEQTFTNEEIGTTTVTPLSIKIDFTRANIDAENEKYEILEGANQKFDINKNRKLTFRLSIDYDTFAKEGKIFIDGKEVAKDNYTLSKGSTIVTFNDEYTKTLSLGKHTILASVENGEAKAEFTIAKTEGENTSSIENTNNKENAAISTNNPKTGDNIMLYNFMLGLSIVGLIGIGIYKGTRI